MTIEKYDEENIKYCFGCDFFSMYPKDLDKYKCQFCGCEIEEEFIFHDKCPACGKKEIIYDSLNISENTYVEGRCSFCKGLFKISRCRHCKNDVFYTNNKICSICKKKL